ncbi:hypothetical protein [Synechococcus phage MA10]|uniref:Uncharacterized protein n=1 Tax=Synechococcus phage S-H34 TaxID=2718942 RepID=A0A6G8R6J5_9CAUD|nr:hypothetical protein PQC15_gp132 [Synechococcus phage S-H34]QIN97003.1 hypothetical protein [Synechococcus phage S-H34]
MTEFERYELRRKFIESLTDKEWDVIADSLFDRQCLLRDRCREYNCGDKEWDHIDDIYSLYVDISTFILSK